ncbi:amidase signature domain-containing protein [Crucibulum laeve]|uniref:Amidase signature domain-containing protein n=1 Tax=Crucibulum laeve TaxID=68775 RepID=A0A5C3MEX4_9AGAR|nr:amidase signature domain-containing protein [Crucibulum laeve]
MLNWLFIVGLFSSFVTASVNVLSTDTIGTVLNLSGSPIRFLSPSTAVALGSVSGRGAIPSTLTPTTCIHVKHTPITMEFLESQLATYAQLDDVWNDKFLEALIISYEGPAMAFFDDEAKRWLDALPTTHLFISKSIQPPSLENSEVLTISTIPPPGPYFISKSNEKKQLAIHHVYRLYEDDHHAFLFGAIPGPSGGWVATNITFPIEDQDDIPPQQIPVPSRLPALLSPNAKPLSGARFGLKDIYDAQGLPTAAGSLAYALTHPIPNITATSIASLLTLGAVMVGKTRTSQFAHGAQPWEFLDFPYSWNPRGDGYLTASASSSGSACAIAAYDWLDFTIGSDTRGSVRKPASLVGVYGIRPTTGALNLTGVVPLSEEMDTAGFFARDPRLFYAVYKLWYQGSPVISRQIGTRFPQKLLYPIEHFPVKNAEAQALYDSFITSLQIHLGIVKTPVNMSSMLALYFPDQTFPAFQLSSNKLAEYRSWVSVGKPIVDSFMEQYGTLPTFDPIPVKMFARAQNISEADFQASVAFKRGFQDAVSKYIFPPSPQSCSETLFIYDSAAGGKPSYRFEEFNSFQGAAPFLLTAPSADSTPPEMKDYFNFLASMAELPEVTVPIGQVPYWSQITRRWEMLPVAAQLVVARGCDGMLMELVRKLSENGVVGGVKTGRLMY